MSLGLIHGRHVMVIVSGHLIVDPDRRDAYLDGCRTVVEQARVAPGCLDFAICADLVDPARIDVVERWESRAAVEAFRGGGVDPDQQEQIRSASMAEYDVAAVRQLG